MKTGKIPALNKHNEQITVNGSPITLECFKTTNHATMTEVQKQALPILAEAFADEEIKFVLDNKLQIKKEYAKLIENLPKETKQEQAPWGPALVMNYN